MKQNHHFIVPKANFRMVKGKDFIKTYAFNSHKAQHMFCSICGVQSFYIPRSNQDGYGKYITIEKVYYYFENIIYILFMFRNHATLYFW